MADYGVTISEDDFVEKSKDVRAVTSRVPLTMKRD